MVTAEARPPAYETPVREEYEIDLRGPVTAVSRQLWLVGLLTLLAMTAAAIAVFFMPKEYEGAAKVSIQRPKVSVAFDPRFITRDDFDLRPFYTHARHPEVEKGIQSRMQAELTEEEKSPGGLVGRMRIAIDRDDPGLVTLRITDPDDRKAARLASIWAVAFADYAQHVMNPAMQAQKLVDAQLKGSHEELLRRDDAVRQFQLKSGLGLPLREDGLRLEVAAGQSGTGLPQSPAAPSGSSVSMPGATLPAASRLGTRGRELMSRATTVASFRSNRDQTRLVLAQARALRAAGTTLDVLAPELAQLGVLAARGTTQTPPPAVDADQTIRLLEAKERALGEAIDQMSAEIRTLESALANDVADLERLERERDLARDAYTTLARKAEENKVALGADWPAVQVFSLAGARAPEATKPWALALGGAGAAGLVIGVVVALLRQSRAPRPRP